MSVNSPKVKGQQSGDNSSLVDNLYLLSMQVDKGFCNINIPIEDIDGFRNENYMTSAIMEFFIFNLVSKLSSTAEKIKTVLIITSAFLKNFEQYTNDYLREVFKDKNILTQKFILFPILTYDNGAWSLAVIENLYMNFSDNVFDKFVSPFVTHTSESVARIHFFVTEGVSEKIKDLKNFVVTKMENFYLRYMTIKYKVKNGKCFRKSNFDVTCTIFNKKLTDAESSLEVMKIITDCLENDEGIKSYFNALDTTPFGDDFVLCIRKITKPELLAAIDQVLPSITDNQDFLNVEKDEVNLNKNQNIQIGDNQEILQENKPGFQRRNSLLESDDFYKKSQTKKLTSRVSSQPKSTRPSDEARRSNNNNTLRLLNMILPEEKTSLKKLIRRTFVGTNTNINAGEKVEKDNEVIIFNSDTKSGKPRVDTNKKILSLCPAKIELRNEAPVGKNREWSKGPMQKDINLDLLDRAFQKVKNNIQPQLASKNSKQEMMISDDEIADNFEINQPIQEMKNAPSQAVNSRNSNSKSSMDIARITEENDAVPEECLGNCQKPPEKPTPIDTPPKSNPPSENKDVQITRDATNRSKSTIRSTREKRDESSDLIRSSADDKTFHRVNSRSTNSKSLSPYKVSYSKPYEKVHAEVISIIPIEEEKTICENCLIY